MRLDEKMTAAFHAVADLARKRKLFMRDAAYVISVSRVAKACRDRGWVLLEAGKGERLQLESIDCQLDVDSIYEGVFEQAEEAR